MIDLPEICTPEEVACALRWNKQAVLKAVRSGKLKGSRLSQKHIIIRREHVIQFVEDTCPGQTGDFRLNEEATGAYGKSGNTYQENGSDTERALTALKKLRPYGMNLKENSASVVSLNSARER